MNLADPGKRVVLKFSILLIVLSVTAVASAGRTQQKSEPEHKSAPSKPASHSAPAHKSAPSKPASHSAPTHKPAPRPVSHLAPAHKPAPSKALSHPTPAEHAGRPSVASEHSPTPTRAHAPAGEHTTPTEHAPVGIRDVSLRTGGSASIRSNGQIRSSIRTACTLTAG